MSMPYAHIRDRRIRKQTARIDALNSLEKIENELKKLRLIADAYSPESRNGIINHQQLAELEITTHLMALRALKSKS